MAPALGFFVQFNLPLVCIFIKVNTEVLVSMGMALNKVAMPSHAAWTFAFICAHEHIMGPGMRVKMHPVQCIRSNVRHGLGLLTQCQINGSVNAESTLQNGQFSQEEAALGIVWVVPWKPKLQ